MARRQGPRDSFWDRHVVRPRFRRDHQIAVGLLGSVGAALAAAALGLLPDIAADWADEDDFSDVRAWILLALVFLAVATLTGAAVLWRGRQLWVTENGTAYLVRETVHGWDDDQFDRFKEAVEQSRSFGRVVDLLGPFSRTGQEWPSGADGVPPRWSTLVDDLIAAFLVAGRYDDRRTVDSVFLTLPGPAALAFGYRLHEQARSRPMLQVRQRPSSGAGPVVSTEAALAARPHGVDDIPPGLAQVLSGTSWECWEAALTFAVRGPRPPDPTEGRTPVAVVVVRLVPGAWGPVRFRAVPLARRADNKIDPDAMLTDDPTLTVVDASGTGLAPGRTRLVVHELLGAPQTLPFAAYLSLADAALGLLWRSLEDLAGSGSRAPVLAVVQAPNEVQFLVGARARRRAGVPPVDPLLVYYAGPDAEGKPLLVVPDVTLQGRPPRPPTPAPSPGSAPGP